MRAIATFLILTITSIYAQNQSSDLHEQYVHAQQLDREGKHDQAIEAYEKILASHPDHFNACVKLASLYYDQRKSAQAITCYQKAIAAKPLDAHLHYNLGLAYIQQEAWQNAIEELKKTIDLDPFHDRVYLNLGTAYEKLKQHEDAISAYKQAIANHPQSVDAYRNLGNVFCHLERLEEALEPYRKAVELQPRNVHAMMELANALNMLDLNQEALEWYEKMLQINPNIISALYNFGYTLKKMGAIDRALEIYDQVISKKSDYASARFSRSGIYLMRGDFERGWDEYEWRWKAYDEDPKRFNRPLWEGEDIAGKTLLIYAEQGLGDTLQFVRYLKYLKEHINNVRIMFETQEPLVTLLRGQPYIDVVIARNERPPSNCHYHVPLMSLPRIVKTRVETIPADIPYLSVPPHLVSLWKKRLAQDTQFKIGICWQGNSHYSTLSLRRAVAAKSIALSLLAPLFDIKGISIYSLQQVDGIDQITQCPFKEKLKTFDKDFDKTNGRFMDTAAVIKNLDLVISVDTGVCHLAGALGVPTWILLPEPADWRWLVGHSDTPWYPNVRLFKQKKQGDWSGAIEEIVHQLKELSERNFTPLTHAPQRNCEIDPTLLHEEQLIKKLN